MPHRITDRPGTDEYAPFYQGYVGAVPEGDLMALLEQQLVETTTMLQRLSPEVAASRYAEGKWSVLEVIGHIADTERVMAYRALRIGRGDATPLPGFDQDAFVIGSPAHALSLADLLADLRDAVSYTHLTLPTIYSV